MTDLSSFDNCKAEFHTLGCKLNFAETSTIARIFAERGIRRAQPGEVPDICVVNTCSVTELADKKCRQTIRRLANRYPDAVIVVTGCYAQLKKDEVAAIDGVDIVLGSEQKMEISAYLDRWLATRKPQVEVTPAKDIRAFSPSCSRGDRTRYFLKVQDGCNYYCTYCTIPYARGNSRNPSISSLVAHAHRVASEGGKEIILTGVNIGDFGRSTGESFIDLVRELDKVEGIQRYRISSIEPNLLTDELIKYCSQSRAFMPHFHIPLQSGSDEVLRLMHRRYDTELFRHKVELIKSLMPDAFIGVDVMVGCRGETEKCFSECYDFIDSLDVQQLHIFPYSERPGTAALKIPYIVDDREKHRRSHLLLELSDKKTHGFYQRYEGCEAEVLMERSTRGRAMHGFTENYIRVELPAAEAVNSLDNQIVKLRLLHMNHDKTALIGTFN